MNRALVATMLFVAGCSKGSAPSADPATAVSAEIASAQALNAELEKELAAAKASPRNQIDPLRFADAVNYAKSFMTDTTDETSPGALLLATWGTTHMEWADVSVSKDETSYALTRKDPDEARGKRLCTSGKIIQIQVNKLDNGRKVFDGLLLSDGGNLYDFIAVGSSGQLVQSSYARFCGVVIGAYDYQNSGGGTGHAVALVGMFDLPENKVKPAAPVEAAAVEAPERKVKQSAATLGTARVVSPAAPQPEPPPSATTNDSFLTAPVAPPPGIEAPAFNMGAAKSSLATAAAGAQSCRSVEGLTGTGRVVVVFDPSGEADSATLQGPPFEGTPTGTCIIGQFHRAHAAPFSGSPMSVSKSFTIQ